MDLGEYSFFGRDVGVAVIIKDLWVCLAPPIGGRGNSAFEAAWRITLPEGKVAWAIYRSGEI